MTHAYKKVAKPEAPREYHPAAAVRKYGDGWKHHVAVWSIVVCPPTDDFRDAIAMCMMERGQLARVAE